MKTELDRRNFIKLVSLFGGSMLLPPFLFSCNGCEGNSAGIDSGDIPFGIWRQMIELLEQSPDHLIGRRKALVAAKDPLAMTEFVRDSFQLIPPRNNDFMRYMKNSVLYGTETALRCGLATPREKAEILKDMLTEAGFEAKVVYESTNLDEDDLKRIIFRKYLAEFNPPISKSQLNKWQRAMPKKKNDSKVEAIENPDKITKDFENEIISNISDKTKDRLKDENNLFNFRFESDKIPSVVYTVEGEEKFAHVFDPDVPTGELHPKNESQKIFDSNALSDLDGEVKISLSCRTAIEPWIEKELLSGVWKLSDISGSMIFVQFLNNMNFEQQVTHTISQIDTFTPAFSFQKFGVSKEYMQDRSVMGESIDLNGFKTEKKEEESIISEEEEIQKTKEDEQTETEKTDSLIIPVADSVSTELTDSLSVPVQENPLDSFKLPEMVAGTAEDVKTLEIIAIPKTFPKVIIEVSPRDADGRIVNGLSAKDLSLTDNGQSVSGRIVQNQISPKILLLYDTSLSMPGKYRNKEQINSFLTLITKEIKELYPNAEIKLQETGSDLYTTMLKGKQSGYDVITYLTDGDNNDKFNPVYSDVYESGYPIIILEVRNSSYTYDELKKNIKNLISLPAVEYETAINEILKAIAQMDFPPYVIAYSSFDELKEHTAKLILKESNVSGEAKFKFPEPNDEFIGDRIVGLYLTVEGFSVKVRRTIAGWDNQFYKFRPSRTYIDDVHEMMLGSLAISFEREAPPLSVRMTEYLTAMLSHEKWIKAQKAGDTEEAVKLLEEGVLNYPPMFLSMIQPPNDVFNNDQICFPFGLRAAILKSKPGLYSENSRLSFDYLQMTHYTTFSKSGNKWENVKRNIKNTLQFAALESVAFEESTLMSLKGKSLMTRGMYIDNKGKYADLYNNGNPVVRNRILNDREHSILFDDSFKSSGYFKLNEQTGEVFAMLPDGTGGGGNEVASQLKELEKVVKDYQRLQSAMGLMIMGAPGGFALGVVNAYGLTLVKLYAAASEAIIIMDAGNLDEGVKEALQGLACNVMMDIALLGFGGFGKTIDGLQKLIGMMGGNASPC